MAEVEAVKSQFLVRLSSLPVVHSALGYATHTYGRVKEVNPVINFTLSTAEKSVLFASAKAQPIVKKFERQISLADGLALKGLEKLEEKVPLITKPTDIMVQDTKNLYNTTIQTGVAKYNNYKSYGVERVNAVKQYGVDTAVGLVQSQYGKIMIDSVNGALSLTEDYIDHILPPLDKADMDDTKKSKVLERVTGLTNRIQQRVYGHALQKAQNIKQVTTDSIRHYGSTEVISNAYANATWLWEELNKEAEQSDDKTLNHQILNSARFATKQLVSAFVTAKTTIHVIPSRVNESITTVYNFSASIPSHLNNGLSTLYTFSTSAVTYINHINPQEVATAAVQLKDRLNFEDRVTFLVQTITQYPAVQWLIPSFNLDGSQDLFEEDEIFNREPFRNTNGNAPTN